MRKLYALLAGLIISLAGIKSNAQSTADIANFTFGVDLPNLNVNFTNTSVIGSEPGPRYALWQFGDGNSQWTPPLGNTSHHYSGPGTYTVCLKIYRFTTNTQDSVLTAQVCKTVVIETGCHADFDYHDSLTNASPPAHIVKFTALPSTNPNNPVTQVCWYFGDGASTCVDATAGSVNDLLTIKHTYTQPGTYNVCVRIKYLNGCLAEKCKTITLLPPADECRADFERIQTNSAASLYTYFQALPWHNNNKKPVRICWTFGDGRDTCIQYSSTSTGPYAVSHLYNHAGNYEVCVDILYMGGCEARKCKTLQIGRPDSCTADFERLPTITADNPLTVALKALPWNNNDKKPYSVCWTFGDGRDTCISYLNIYSGSYTVKHTYHLPGQYEVCVKIVYYGGCESRKCKNITVYRPDSCKADFERIETSPTADPLRVYFKALPAHNNEKKPSRICWNFGDGRDTCINYETSYTGLYYAVHNYLQPGQYQVCVSILYFGGCEARKCKQIVVTRPDSCRADFERIPTISIANPLRVYLKALPWHNNNKKPSRICWTFGDGRDTCINYETSFTGQYVVAHNYFHSGLYEVCVKILYFGGCEARKCKNIQVSQRDSCSADFEKIPTTSNTLPLRTYFKAIPWNSNNNKPSRICWTFGDGRDTCINYETSYTGQYYVPHNYMHPGLYEVCVNILYFGGCEARKCKNVQIGERDSCSADFERLPSTSATSLTAGFKALPWNSQQRKPQRICWKFGDGRDTCITYSETFTGLYTVNHTYPHAGQYEACVSILYFGGCEAYKCKEIVIPPVTTSDCSVKIFEITPSLTSLTRGFYASIASNPTSRLDRICWNFGDGQDTCINIPPDGPLPELVIRHTYQAPGIYRACVSVRFHNGCESHDCIEVVIHVAANVCGGYMLDSLINPHTYKFKGVSINSPNDQVNHYYWNFGDGSTATGQEVTHTFANAGDYQVCLTITTALGCETRICKTVRVPGNNQSQLHLSPNPAVNTLHVEFFSTQTETISVKILNSNGVQVRSYVRAVTVGPNGWDIDVTGLLPGIYSFVIQSPNQLASAIFLKV